MTKLVWDKVGERLYETGIDRGVLYLADGSAVPWNGLTSVNETVDDATTPVYFDGVKYQDVQSTGDFAASLTAFTYPDEFLEYEGVVDLGNGVFVDGQNSKSFGLSYRTYVANDVNGTDHGYKIHILYNLTATPSAVNYSTMASAATPIPFSWTLTGIPEGATGFRPTAHVIFDSRYLSPTMLAGLEDLIYGSDAKEALIDGGTALSSGTGELDGGTYNTPGADIVDGLTSDVTPAAAATLPTLDELVDFISFWDPKKINPQSVTGLSTLTPGMGDLTQINIDGLYSALPSTRLVPAQVDGFYTYGPGILIITYLGNGVWTAEDFGGYISMTDATTFQIISDNAIYLDATTYTISSQG